MALGGVVAGSARVIVGADTRDLDKGMRDSERNFVGTMGRMRGAAVGVGGVIAGVLGGSLVVALKSSVDAASNLEEQINKTSTVFRGSEQDILRWSETTAAGFGISQRAALEAAGTFGNMLVPMGFARDRAGEMSKAMVELAADMASFNNASPEETLLAIRSGLAGETEPLRRFGVFLNEARIQAEALSSGLIKQGQELTAAGKAQATYQIILKDTADTAGDFSRTSGALANQQRILRAQFEEVQAEIGAKLLPVLVRLLNWVNNDAIPSFQHFGSVMARVWRTIVRESLEAVRDVVEPWSHLPGELGEWARDIKDRVNDELAKMSAEEGIRQITEEFENWDVTAATAAGQRVGQAWGSAFLGSAAPYLDALTGDVTPPGGAPGGTGLKGGQAAAGGARMVFPIPAGVSFQRGGGMAAHGSRALGNWQSDRAVDIMVEAGTPILSVVDGVVTKTSGQAGFGSGGTIYGFSVTISGEGNRFFYTHLGAVYVSQGQRVQAGQVIGLAAAGTPGGPHLHFATEQGAPEDIYRAARAKLDAQGKPKPTTTTFGTDKPSPTSTAGELVPPRLRLAVAQAEITKDNADDLRALADVEAYLEKRVAAEKNVEQRIKLIQELSSVRSRIASIGAGDTPTTAAATDLIPPRFRLAVAEAELTKQTGDDLQALRNVENYLEKRLKGEKDVNDRLELVTELKSVRDRIAALAPEEEEQPLIPKALQLRLAQAEVTKQTADDLAALDAIIVYLEGRLAREKDINKRLEILRDLRSYRERVAAEVGPSRAAGTFGETVEELIGAPPREDRGPARPLGEALPAVSAREQEEINKILASGQPQLAKWAAYARELIAKRKAAQKLLAQARKALQTALKRPARMRKPSLIAQIRADIAAYEEDIRQLTEAIDDAIARYGELEAVLQSDILEAAGEDERSAETAPRDTAPGVADTGGGLGGGGGGGVGGGEGGPTAPAIPSITPEQAAAMRAEILGAKSGFFREFSPNVFHGPPGMLELGAAGPLTPAPSNVTVIQNFNTPPPDQHSYFMAAAFAAEHALG